MPSLSVAIVTLDASGVRRDGCTLGEQTEARWKASPRSISGRGRRGGGGDAPRGAARHDSVRDERHRDDLNGRSAAYHAAMTVPPEELLLAAEFPPSSRADWRTLALGVLRKSGAVDGDAGRRRGRGTAGHEHVRRREDRGSLRPRRAAPGDRPTRLRALHPWQPSGRAVERAAAARPPSAGACPGGDHGRPGERRRFALAHPRRCRPPGRGARHGAAGRLSRPRDRDPGRRRADPRGGRGVPGDRGRAARTRRRHREPRRRSARLARPHRPAGQPRLHRPGRRRRAGQALRRGVPPGAGDHRGRHRLSRRGRQRRGGTRHLARGGGRPTCVR